MAVAAESTGMGGLSGFTESNAARNLALAIGAALVVALMVGAWLWSQQPDYRVLFSNYSDRDGGAIVTALQQMNVPYKFAEGGGAILVPAAQVYDARLKLASQGLPKGGSVGFELMENQKLGVSQFLEQVNFQRALEGELARSIQAIGAVQTARVHLALPKASVFVRDQQKPTASVVLNLNQGRTLDAGQVSAIVHLVASSVPELSSKSVTVVDQSGNLLSESDKPGANNGLDPAQLKYVQDLQQSIVKRIESIISPLVGPDNVRAEATADVDFSHSEQAAEVYKPNQTPNSGTIRSQQTNETGTGAAAAGASGVPGALSNQPPSPATAPITAAAAPGAATATGAAAPVGANGHRESTVNYEVDKTIRYVQQPMGGVKRLSVAVVVNYKRDVDKAGKVTNRALTEAEKTQISDLVKEAMGFNKDRGDTLNIANSQFAGVEAPAPVDVPIWKNPDNIQTAKDVGKYLLGAAVILYLFFAFLKPMLKKLMANAPKPRVVVEERDTIVDLHTSEPMGQKPRGYEENLDAAKTLARNDPKVVANVVKAWVDGNE
ncbi:MAG: flagellar M-ring protein FliF [Herminiimonas sp.]|nr:flagellar M-ring protein FliF [Herminiimonas sp.]